MPVTVKVNGTSNSLVHKGSNGISTATIPDVCKVPTPGGPVPTPFPNISQSITLNKGTKTVKADRMMAAIKGSEFSLSNGDNPGVLGGVKSNTFMKESTWILYSFDVKMDGKNACRLTDKKFQNHQNTVDLAGVLQNPAIVEAIGPELGDEICTAICDARTKANNGELPSAQYPTLQSYVASKFSSGYPLFTPVKPELMVEMTWKIPTQVGGAFTGVMSGTGRTLAGSGLPAPGSLMTGLNAGRGAPGTTFRPDFTLLSEKSSPAGNSSNVKNFIEVKFNGDNSTPNQKYAQQQLGSINKSKYQEIKESDCKCN